MSSPAVVEELTATLTLEFKAWPGGPDDPDGTVVMLRKRHTGQLTLSARDWRALCAYTAAAREEGDDN